MVGFGGGDIGAGRVPVVLLASTERGARWALELSRRGHVVTLCSDPAACVVASRLLGGCPVLVGEGFDAAAPADAVRRARTADKELVILALVAARDRAAFEEVVEGGGDDVMRLEDGPDRVSGRLRILDRVRASVPPTPHRFGSLELDPRARTVRMGGAVTELRPREFGVLLHLVHAAGRTVAFDELQEVQWGEQEEGEAAMRSCVYRLRKALADHPEADVEIETVRNRGYRLRALDGVAK